MKEQNNQKKIKKIGIIFFVSILILTFFSKTIANMTLPTVRVCVPQKKNIKKEAIGEATTKLSKVVTIYAPISTKILKAYVQEGALVNKGQKLYSLDTTSLVEQMQVQELEVEKKKSFLKGLQQDLIIINEKIDKKRKQLKEKQVLIGTNTISESLEIQNAKKLVEANQTFYEEGIISEQELIESQIKYANLVKEQEEGRTNKKEEVKTKLQEINDSLEEFQNEKITKAQEIEQQQLELKSLELKLSQLAKKKEQSSILVADASGIIMEKEEGKGICLEGELISEAEPIMKMGIVEEGYEAKFIVDKTINFINEGDKVDLEIGSQKDIKGKVIQVKDVADQLELRVSFKEPSVRVNQRVKATFKEEDKVHYNVIPREVLYKEADYYYVYTVEQANDELGSSYSVRKTKVYVEDYSDEYAAIAEGIDATDWVVVSSEKEIAEGSRVKVENENEVLDHE